MEKRKTAGIIYAASSYLIWGFTPLYWKFFSGIGSELLLAHRMFWAFFFSIALLALTGGFGRLRAVLSDRKSLGWIAFRTLLLSVNWYIYIWAVSHGRVLEASLGYYLNPLVSILLGLIFLKESLNRLQWVAVGFAVFGVVIKAVLVGSFPAVSLILAFSFGFYGLMKKKSTDGSLVGMTVESLLLLPLSTVFLIMNEFGGTDSFIAAEVGMKLLFVSTGLITVTPLILFAKGNARIPLSWIGFLQFIAPTMMLIFGVSVYGESISFFELFGFASVWVGIALFLVSSRKS